MTTKARAGRPSKLTSELVNELANLLRAGAMIDAACSSVGISRDTYYAWMHRGREKRAGLHREFTDTVKKALAFSEITALVELRKGRPGWQALAWFLERRHKGRWGRRGNRHGKQ
ncbi:MAG: hypothetical protein FJW32_20745 [Acidobacteria bacterium]|nr:hypothetical protein [Acidobacteriota bacterium]